MAEMEVEKVNVSVKVVANVAAAAPQRSIIAAAMRKRAAFRANILVGGATLDAQQPRSHLTTMGLHRAACTYTCPAARRVWPGRHSLTCYYSCAPLY